MPLTRRDFLKASSGVFILPLSFPQDLLGDSVKIPVLMYHDISNEINDEYTVSPSFFSAHMEWLYSNGYKTLFFTEVEGSFRDADQPAVIITFDDGYASFGSYAFPLLKEYGFKATVNAIGKNIGGYIKLGVNRPLLSWDEYRSFMKSGLVELGCHTYNLHIYKSGLGLSGFSPKEVEDDFRLFQDIAHKETGHRARILSWPYGIYDEKTIKVAQDTSFMYALTSDEGSHPLKIPRWHMNNSHDLISFQQYVKGER
jgi:peptidoglycan/xylan/chitin deacetylase (PgdA/CDA1 family)